MSVAVRYFAGLSERLGRRGDEVDIETPSTVADIWRQVSGTDALPHDILCAVNLEYVSPDHPVTDGDEIAFFPPVTGG